MRPLTTTTSDKQRPSSARPRPCLSPHRRPSPRLPLCPRKGRHLRRPHIPKHPPRRTGRHAIRPRSLHPRTHDSNNLPASTAHCRLQNENLPSQCRSHLWRRVCGHSQARLEIRTHTARYPHNHQLPSRLPKPCERAERRGREADRGRFQRV